MSPRASAPGRSRPLAPTLAITTVLLMAAEWILLVAGTRPHEMIVGAFSVLASALFLFAVHRQSDLHLDLHAADLLTAWQLPWYLAKGIADVTVVLVRDLLGLERAPSLYRVAGFTTADRDPRLAARRVLATVYTTSTPNCIVLGIDYTQSRMLFHQVRRGPLPKFTRDLGARS